VTATAVEGRLRRCRAPAEATLRRAQRQVERWCVDGPHREWVGPIAIPSYGSERGGAVVYALQGSPLRGYVIASAGHVLAFDATGNRRRAFWCSEAARA
jgi:hypothetical protein